MNHIFIFLYFLEYSVLLLPRIRQKRKKKYMRKKERAEKKEKACLLFLKVLFYIFMASDLSPLENAMAVSPQCRLRTLHPCSTEAA